MIMPQKKKENENETIPRRFGEEDIIDLASQMKDDSEGFIEKLEDAFEEASDSKKPEIFFRIGSILFNHSYLVLGLTSWFHSLSYYIKIGDKRGESTCYSNIGMIHNDLGQYQKAIGYFEKALPLFKDIVDISGLSLAYRILASITQK
jgi:tetratricopeptide (TPR) repeat protein